MHAASARPPESVPLAASQVDNAGVADLRSRERRETTGSRK